MNKLHNIDFWRENEELRSLAHWRVLPTTKLSFICQVILKVSEGYIFK